MIGRLCSSFLGSSQGCSLPSCASLPLHRVNPFLVLGLGDAETLQVGALSIPTEKTIELPLSSHQAIMLFPPALAKTSSPAWDWKNLSAFLCPLAEINPK